MKKKHRVHHNLHVLDGVFLLLLQTRKDCCFQAFVWDTASSTILASDSCPHDTVGERDWLSPLTPVVEPAYVVVGLLLCACMETPLSPNKDSGERRVAATEHFIIFPIAPPKCGLQNPLCNRRGAERSAECDKCPDASCPILVIWLLQCLGIFR